MKKRILAAFLGCALFLTACGNSEAPADSAESSATPATTQESAESSAESAEEATGERTKIVLGVSPVPHAEIAEAAKENLAKRGIDLEIKSFDDYVQPNLALASGDLDANYFQHKPYLDNFIKENNLDLTSIGSVHIEPMGIFSAQLKSLDEVPDGAKVLIPNDVTNGGRALLLLEKQGLIKLDDPSNINVTEANITENPKNLTFVPLEAAAVGRTYQDGDLAVINANYALEAGLNPVKDALAVEDQDSPYANIVAVRTGEENEEKFKILMEELQSETIKKFIEDKYEGAVIPAFADAK